MGIGRSDNVNAGFYTQNQFVWWTGTVVDNKDPRKNGRLKVEIHGRYDGVDKKSLPWALPLGTARSASMAGVGASPTGVDIGSVVVGFFLDGEDAQTPVYIGTLFGEPGGTADTAWNAREIQKIPKKTLLKGKRPSGGEWKEPDTSFAAKYPLNHTITTKNGHAMELDDSDGAIRFHYRHPSKTDIEIHDDGRIVIHGAKDAWQMYEDTLYIHTEADINISVKGNANVKVDGDAHVKIDGNLKTEVGGNYNLKVDGDWTCKIGGNQTSTSGGNETRKAPMIMLN